MTATPRFTLYSFWRTSATYRVRVALALKGLDWEEHNINLDAGEQKGGAFLKINPMGAIPALIDNGAGASHAPVTQSLAILEYLEEVAPTPALLPKDPAGRARVRSIALTCVADSHPLITARIKKYLIANAGFNDDQFRAWQTNWLTQGLQAVEKRLATEKETGTYCHGDTITIADICVASLMAVAPIFKIEIADIPNVKRIMSNVMAQDAFVKAEPMRQVGAPKV